jgi:ABC-type glycerol-3-phosphate transport system substrate-binding protein
MLPAARPGKCGANANDIHGQSGRNDRDEDNLAATTAAAAGFALLAGAAAAQEIRFMCYSDGNECEVYDDVLTRFEAENEGIDVIVDVVPYQAILENLPVQLAAGTGPDMARSPTSAA